MQRCGEMGLWCYTRQGTQLLNSPIIYIDLHPELKSTLISLTSSLPGATVTAGCLNLTGMQERESLSSLPGGYLA